ncbi:sugar ABC transporter substrate-binding protein [Candidatus Poriferisodalis sp.]|uniref:sugar ABC transporter substrate-binding protein n=1 Tax=Candidatus Poriferisodalis sp. TaxID=3101277 RepID=UPI003C70217E
MATISRRRLSFVWLALVAVLALVAAACGDSDDGAAGGDQTESTTSVDDGAEVTPESEPETEAATTTETSTQDDEGAEDQPEPVESEEPFQVAYLSASSANTWLLSSRLEMEAVAAANNVEITEFDAQFDPGLQTTQFQDVIASGTYDGVILVSVNGIASAPDIAAAHDAGMEVVILNQVVGEDFSTSEPQVAGVSANVMAAPFVNGRRLGELTVLACADRDPCEVVYIYGIKGLPIDDAARAGLDEVIAGHPSIKVVAEGEGQYLGPEGGINATQDILQIAPDFDVLVGADQSVQGAEIVLAEEDKLDHVRLVGWGGSTPALEGIAAGRWFGGVFGAPGDEGRIAMEAMVSALTGGPDFSGVDPLVDLPDNGLVTADNVSLFTAQWDG